MATLILKSTVPPFTTSQDVVKPLRKHAIIKVAFCPERLKEGNAIEECKNIPANSGGVLSTIGQRFLGNLPRY